MASRSSRRATQAAQTRGTGRGQLLWRSGDGAGRSPRSRHSEWATETDAAEVAAETGGGLSLEPILELRGGAETLGLAEELQQAERWRRSQGTSMRGPARNRLDNEAHVRGRCVVHQQDGTEALKNTGYGGLGSWMERRWEQRTAWVVRAGNWCSGLTWRSGAGSWANENLFDSD